MSKNGRWLGSPIWKRRRSKRCRNRRPWLETLERREMLYAALQNLQLYNDTDTPGDLITSDPTVTGSVTGDFIHGANLEFDHDADGFPEGYYSVSFPEDSFTYDPRNYDPSLDSYSGTFPLQIRVVEYDEYYMPMSPGAWQDFTFTMNSGGSSSDPGDDLASAQTVSLTTGVASEMQAYVGDGLYSSGDVDLFKISLTAGQTLTVDIDAEYLDAGTSYSLLDSHLRLFDSSGMELAHNGDAQSGNDYGSAMYDSYLSFSVSMTDDYYVGVSSSGNEYYYPNMPGMGSSSYQGDYVLQLMATSGGGGSGPEIEVHDVYQSGIVDGTTHVDFGMTQPGQPVSQTFTVLNQGDADLFLDVNSLQVPGGFSVLSTFGSTVAPNGGQTSFSIQLDGSIGGNYSGDVSFTNNDSDESPFTFSVSGYVDASGGGGNSAPTVETPVDNQTVNEDAPPTVIGIGNVFADSNVGDSLTITIAGNSNPSLLSPAINGSNLTLTYGTDLFGVGTITLRATDLSGAHVDTSFQVLVATVDDPPPGASDYAFQILHDTTLSLNQQQGVLPTLHDVDGNALTTVAVAQPGHGTLVLNADGSLTYTPDLNYVGTDVFSYKITDGNSDSNVGTVSLLVFNHAPVPVGDWYGLPHDTSLSTTLANSLLANDIELDGEPLQLTLVNDVAAGTLSLNADGTFAYSPNTSFVGIDTFTYFVSDGIVDSEPVTVTLEVTNLAPWTNDRRYSTRHDVALQVTAPGLLEFSGDTEGDSLSLQVTDDVDHGSLTLNADGSLTYTPASGYVGPDRFTFVVSDGIETSEPAVVDVTVTNAVPPGCNRLLLGVA